MIKGLIQFFEQHVELNKEETQYVMDSIPVQEIGKNTLLLAAGEISKSFYFILNGSVRMYYDVDGVEKTAFFYFENSFVSSYESFTRQVPAKHKLQTLENTTVAVISSEVAMQLVDRFPKFEFLARIMMEEELIVYQEIISSFITLNAEQRYLKLLNEQHPILQRIPQHQLATYLGVTAETLSRIRKRINNSDIS
jgi:CRP-like cAMP-binding protein